MRLIIPNYHVILIHFPLALLGIGILIELFSCCWYGDSFHKAGRWMIFIGTLLLVPTATSGIFALYDVAGHGQPGGTWSDVKAASGFSDQDWRLAKNHVLFTGVGTAIALLAVVAWLGSSDRARRKLHLFTLLALIIAIGMFTFGAWTGGEMVFREGFGVAGKFQTVDPTLPPQTNEALKDKIDDVISPYQIHLILAGFVLAVAAGAIGLSYRRCTVEAQPLPTPQPPAADPSQNSSLALAKSVYSLEELVAAREVAGPPPSRFWMLAALLALFTIATGFYIGDFFGGSQFFDVDHLKHAMANLHDPNKQRMGLHIILGGWTLILSLILAITAKMRPINRTFLGIFSILLILVVAAQFWMGILLLYDDDRGPLTKFNSAPVSVETPPTPIFSATTNPTTQP